MSFRFSKLIFPIATLLASACGGGGNSTPDAGSGVDATGIDAAGDQCAKFDSPATTISTYPNSFDGNLAGAGASHTVAEGICADERTYFAQDGEDQVLQLDGLTAGQRYGVVLAGPGDLAMYVVNGCSGTAVTADECLVFTDDTVDAEPEILDFVAPTSGTAFLVVDHFAFDEPIVDGSYSVSVVEAECVSDTECSAATPSCSNFTCVECTSHFDCGTIEAGVCDPGTNTCIAGFDACTGDDAEESDDDGPLGATLLADPTALTPTVVAQSICNAPLAEADFFTIDIAADTTRTFTLDWTGTATDPDLDMILFDSMGVAIDASFEDKPEVMIVRNVAAGTYFMQVNRFHPAGTEIPAAVDYTLTVAIPECSDDFDCINPLASVCNAALSCVAGPAECTNDDANEDNDGPAAATQLVSGVPMQAAICNTPGNEVDFYKITVANSQSLDVEVAFDGANMADIDVRVLDAQGEVLGFTFWLNPENVNLTFLPAGEYLVEVTYFGQPAIVDAHPYTLTATVVTPIVGCSATTCDDSFRTQVYRGNCNVQTGACSAIEGNDALAQDAPCDTPDDCTSGVCSYLPFQQGAANSVCTVNCTASSECVTAHGAGYSCTSALQNNICHPDCAGNLDCGANVGSDTLDPNEPWDYGTCNAGACDI